MYQNNYAASTTNTYVSAIGYCHRLAGFHDPTKVFFIMEMLKGYGKLDFRVDTRLPITLPILKQILKVSSSTASSPYRACLFNAMCTTAFFAFLRIGEVTTTPQSSSVMQLSQVSKLVDDAGLTIGLKITFYHFKHSYNQRPISISLTRRADICPVQVLLDYLSQRGYNDGALFHTLDGLPVSRAIFTTHLAMVFTQCGLDPSKYKGDSFRIGAASYAAECGFSDAQILLMGR